MNKFYTDEVNAQIIISLLKANGIKRIIASPGTTNIPITGSVQNDPFFEVYSSVDERSAAYMACGMAYESGEPVVLTCTGATASRNYLPGLTEAYYRKLPVIAITSTGSITEVSHLLPQCIDRSTIPKDVAKLSVTLAPVKDKEDFWDCEIKANKAILEVKRAGGGPVHINLVTSYMKTFNTRKLPAVRAIQRYNYNSALPAIDPGTRVAIFIGAHKPFAPEEVQWLEQFVKTHNAVVLCDHTSSYRGFGRILGSLACSQSLWDKPSFQVLKPELIIHIGEVSGDYPTMGVITASQAPVWRVSEDGELRDRFRHLACVFEMPEMEFFKQFAEGKPAVEGRFMTSWHDYLEGLREKKPELPFSNTWIAGRISQAMPPSSNVHFGILNSLRNWNLFETKPGISTACNVGGFGIDGCVSTLIGACLANRDKLNFGIIGDLAFFYDLNSIGNRHLPRNLRIILINNGGGCEFELSTHFGSQFGEQTGDFISAGGHYGNKSSRLVKHLAEDLGFIYMSASNKDQFYAAENILLTDSRDQKPVVLECFTDFREESQALELMSRIDQSVVSNESQESTSKQILKKGVDETVRIMLRGLPRPIKKSLKKALN